MSQNNTDALVLELLKKVEEKKQQIGNAERPQWETNCSFRYDPNNNAAINIQVVREIEQLVDIHAFVSTRYHTYIESLKELGCTEKEAPFKWLNFSFEQWNNDIQTRINSLRIKTKRDELARLEERVNALVSPEQRRTIELAKLVKEIG